MPHLVVYCVGQFLHFTVTLYCHPSLCIVIPFSSVMPSSSCGSSGGGAGTLVNAGAGPFGGLGGKGMLLSFSKVAFRSDARFGVLCTTTHRMRLNRRFRYLPLATNSF